MRISCIGSGNVAWNLCLAFDKAGHKVEQVISKTEDHAKALASKFGAHFSDDISFLYDDCDAVILALPDDVIPEIMHQLPQVRGVLIHTCGSHEADILKEKAFRYGVLYPLQTMTKGLDLDILNVPFLLEASDATAAHAIEELAGSISNNVRHVSAKQRAMYQMAAVISNNFTNYLYCLSAEYLEKHDLEFEMLHPLILQTAIKATHYGPMNSQTGPAKRGDLNTLDKHRGLLKDDIQLMELYELITMGIMEKFGVH
jgi:predicted short-subunit dehydrogenase-like oxidoreductase (DUF2520 family)